MPRIPDELMPKVAANDLGISMGKLAMLLGVSYHTLHGWARRGSAPSTAIDWLRVELPKAKQKLLEEMAAAHPIDAAKLLTGGPRNLVDAIPPRRDLLRQALGRPPIKEKR